VRNRLGFGGGMAIVAGDSAIVNGHAKDRARTPLDQKHGETPELIIPPGTEAADHQGQ